MSRGCPESTHGCGRVWRCRGLGSRCWKQNCSTGGLSGPPFFVSDEIEMCEYCDFDQIYSMPLPTGIERRKPTMVTTKKTVKKSTKNVKTTVSTPGTSKLATSKRGL